MIQLYQQMLLKRILNGNGIEKELAFIFRFSRTPKAVRAGTGRLRHVIAPFFIQARELLEFVREIIRSEERRVGKECKSRMGRSMQRNKTVEHYDSQT